MADEIGSVIETLNGWAAIDAHGTTIDYCSTRERAVELVREHHARVAESSSSEGSAS